MSCEVADDNIVSEFNDLINHFSRMTKPLGIISISQYHDIDHQPCAAMISWDGLCLRYRPDATGLILTDRKATADRQIYDARKAGVCPCVSRLSR